jgi:hypothetical protein
LLDTGAEISIVKDASLRTGIDFRPYKGINVKWIANTVLKTEGTVTLQLLTQTHETTHTFHVMGDGFDCRYDGILCRDFWEDKKANISYCDREIVMGDVTVKFDPKTTLETEPHKLVLKARTESIVGLPTTSRGPGLISKRELLPGVYLAASLTNEVKECCVTSIVNRLEEDVTTDPPQVELEEVETDDDATVIIFTTLVVEDTNRLSKLRRELRTDHLNGEERVSLIKICEEYNDGVSFTGRQVNFHDNRRACYTHSNHRPNSGNKYKTVYDSRSSQTGSPKTNRADAARWHH